MPEESTARLEERVAALSHRLDRAETTCEQRSGRHVEKDLYNSQHQSFRDEINGIGRRLTDHERVTTKALSEMRADLALARRDAAEATKDLSHKIQRDRQWAIGLTATVLLTLIGYLVAVLT